MSIVIYTNYILSPLVRESRTVSDSGFHSLSAELGFWIPVVSGIPDSLSCNPGFHIPKAKICRIPESLTRASFITLINCVASVSVWFRNKERPRNDEELDFRFWLRSLTLTPRYFTPKQHGNACYAS